MNYPGQVSIGEVYRLVTSDGADLTLTGDVYLLQHRGFGAPPIQFETRQGFRQNGETVINSRLQPLSLAIQIRAKNDSDDRSRFWELRGQLLDIVRPNRGGPIRLDVLRRDGVKRSINVFYDSGLELPWDTELNDYGITTRISFTAYDPVWFDTDGTTFTPTAEADQNLVFPITFPITFGSSGNVYGTGVLNYAGTWRTYPKITISGSYNTARIRNTATDVEVILGVPTSVTEERILNFDPQNLSFVDQDGSDISDELDVNSNVVDFYVLPASELPAGAPDQRIDVILTGGFGTPAITIEFSERYFGI